MRYKIDKVLTGVKTLHTKLESAANTLSDGLYEVYHEFLCSDDADVELCKIIAENFKRPFSPPITQSPIPYPSVDALEIEHRNFVAHRSGLSTCDVGYVKSDDLVVYTNTNFLIKGSLYPKVNDLGFVYWVLLHNGIELRIFESLDMIRGMMKLCENLESIELTDAEAEVILGVKQQNRFVSYVGEKYE